MTEEQASFTPSSVVPAVIAVLWAGALEWYRTQPKIGMVGVGVILVVIAVWSYRHRFRLVSRTSFWLGILVFLISTLGALSFISSTLMQHLTVAATTVIVWYYLDQAVHPAPPILQGRVAIVLMTAAYYGGVLSILSLGTFVVQPWWVLLIIGTILYTTVAIIVWLDLEVPWASFRRALPWVAWLGAELTMVVWWLPTSVYVSSLVATTIGMLFIHLGRHVWRDTWSAGRGRRYLLLGAAVVLLTLLSARWF